MQNTIIHAIETTEYNDIKTWVTDRFLLSQQDDIKLKDLEKNVLTEALRTLIKMLKVNITIKINDNTNYSINDPHDTYFLKKYLHAKLDKLPKNTTKEPIKEVIVNTYNKLQTIYDTYFNFITKKTLPNKINSIDMLIKNNLLQSTEDYYYALVWFGLSNDLLKNSFLYGTLHDEKLKSEEKTVSLTKHIINNIRFKSNLLKNISSSQIKKNIEETIINKLPVQDQLDALNETSTLDTLLKTLMEVQKTYHTIVETKNKTANDVPNLCIKITEWLTNTTLSVDNANTCSNNTIKDILYQIKARLKKKHNELAHLQAIPKIDQTTENTHYKTTISILENLYIKDPNKRFAQTSRKTDEYIDEYIYEYDEAFNFFKNAYDLYEKKIQPIYYDWAIKNDIPCQKNDSLKIIVEAIRNTIEQKAHALKQYDRSISLTQFIKPSESTIKAFSKAYKKLLTKEQYLKEQLLKEQLLKEQLLKEELLKEEPLKKIYITWAKQNGLLDQKINEDTSLQDIVNNIKESIKAHIKQLADENTKSILLNDIDSKNTLKQLSVLYNDVQQKKHAAKQKNNNSSTLHKQDIKHIDSPVQHTPQRKGWFSWFSSWWYRSTKK